MMTEVSCLNLDFEMSVGRIIVRRTVSFEKIPRSSIELKEDTSEFLNKLSSCIGPSNQLMQSPSQIQPLQQDLDDDDLLKDLEVGTPVHSREPQAISRHYSPS